MDRIVLACRRINFSRPVLMSQATISPASLGLLYSFRPQFEVGPLYEFSAGYGPDPTTSPNYVRHVIMVRFVARR